MYTKLDPDFILTTIDKLAHRINERFSGAGLVAVCRELFTLAEVNKKNSAKIARNSFSLRAIVILVTLAGIAALLYAIVNLKISSGKMSASDWVQASNAALSSIVMLGAAFLFLVTIENRVKRTRALKALHELRSIAHVIDMHQLTKDPYAEHSQLVPTRSSPKRTLEGELLARYLDYCSEMLALTSKVAALYAQNFHDSVVVTAVNELESLASGLSRKIWQKITIIHQHLK